MTPYFPYLTRPARTLLGIAAVAATFASLTACEPTLDAAPKASAGSADFSHYISVGNSLTAGFEDNGLYRDGQLNSYPSMLAQQFALAGGGSFVQPLFSADQANGNGYLRLSGFDATGSPVLVTVADQLAERGGTSHGLPLLTKFTDPIDNLGVPGLRMSEITTPSLGDPNSASSFYNPLYERLQPDNAPALSYLARVTQVVTDTRPTFFTCWLGNNDVLGYATSGGAVEVLQPSSYSLTSVSTFTSRANSLIDALTANGASGGVVGLIPNVTAIPFFTTVGAKVKQQLGAINESQMVVTTGPFLVAAGSSAPARKTIDAADIKDATGGRQLFTLTGGGYVSLIGQKRGKYWLDFYNSIKDGLIASGLPITFDEFSTVLQLDTANQRFGLDSGNPWPSTLVLDDEEQVRVQERTAAFNAALKAKAEAKGLAVFDAYSFFNDIAAQGLATSGITNSTNYITGNLFSLDGVHPSPRGYAVVANELIRIINAKYGSTLPSVDPGKYRGVKLP